MHLLLWGPFEKGVSSTKSEGFDWPPFRCR